VPDASSSILPAGSIVLDRVSFKNFKSLRAVTLELSPLTVLVGPNGSGKSSVLTGMQLLAQAAEGRASPPEPWQHLAATFSGPRDPRRLMNSGRPSPLELAMREAGGDELTLKVSLESVYAPGEQLVFQVEVNGPGGSLASPQGTYPLTKAFRQVIAAGLNIPSAESVLNHPRVRHFASLVHLHLDGPMLARTSTTDDEEPRISTTGEGLASTLAWMAGAKPDTLTAIAADLARVVPGVRRILTHRERITERVMEKVDIDGQPIWRPVERRKLGDRFSIEFTGGAEIPADLLSEGTVLALGLLTKLHEPGRPRVVLLDDIDRGLHIDAQAKLVATLREFMKLDPGLQIVCTTHSTYLLDLFQPDEVRVLALDDHRDTHAKALTEHPDFEKWRYGTQTGELWAALGNAWVTGQPEKP